MSSATTPAAATEVTTAAERRTNCRRLIPPIMRSAAGRRQPARRQSSPAEGEHVAEECRSSETPFRARRGSRRHPRRRAGRARRPSGPASARPARHATGSAGSAGPGRPSDRLFALQPHQRDGRRLRVAAQVDTLAARAAVVPATVSAVAIAQDPHRLGAGRRSRRVGGSWSRAAHGRSARPTSTMSFVQPQPSRPSLFSSPLSPTWGALFASAWSKAPPLAGALPTSASAASAETLGLSGRPSRAANPPSERCVRASQVRAVASSRARAATAVGSGSDGAAVPQAEAPVERTSGDESVRIDARAGGGRHRKPLSAGKGMTFDRVVGCRAKYAREGR